MKLKEIHRTATFAWSPTPSVPLLASGTVSGALDESFSNESQLEIWELDFMDKSEYDLGGVAQKGPRASVSTSSRFNRVAWGFPSSGPRRGVIATGMENGELGLWDPEKIIETSNTAESLILRNTIHQGSVRGIDFNPIQTNLLSSGAVNGEIYVWDLKDPSKPYSPGSRSSKLSEINSLAWNRQVQYVLASSSATGYTVVWDLRNKREVVALAYSGMAPGSNALGNSGRTGMSDVAWHPDNATRLVTASEDDASPIVMVWDLRNSRAPEKILTGHERGILSLSWCMQDSDLLLSCGKDNRALCWNPQTAEIIGELPYADNWAFQVQWCPRNPDLLATAYFDGTIGIHSLQTTNEAMEAQTAPTPKPDGSDVFDVPGFSRTTQATLSLKQPPRWLRRPISSSFGYGGTFVTVSNLSSAQGRNQSSVVHLRKIESEPTIAVRVKQLGSATEGQTLNEFAQSKLADANARSDRDTEGWKALTSLFKADSRQELVALFGFSKSETAARVADAVEKLRIIATPTQAPSDELGLERRKYEPVVSFAEPEPEPEQEQDQDQDQDYEHTPSEQSASVTSDITDITKAIESESTTTAPSLFGDDIGTPQIDAEADFFSTMAANTDTASARIQIPHQNYAHDSSVAATIGSRPSSAASEALKSNTFKIYPSEESEIDRLLTQSLVLGNFESAVSLCLSAERYADAILLAVKGGPELLQRTQQTYFERRTINLPYLRLFQSIVTEDLDDIVQNADLQEWKEIFVVLCTFAKADEFANLVEQLGQRLEFQASLAKNAEVDGAEELRKYATLTYLAAGRLEKVVNIWIEEMTEEEAQILGDADMRSTARYSAHAHALQSFIEKVTIFRSAIGYADTDLDVTSNLSAVRTYKLSTLYERYFEYADLLAMQGLLKEAIGYLKLIPSDYQSTGGPNIDFSMARERLLVAAGQSQIRKATKEIPSAPAATAQTSAYGYSGYPTLVEPPVATTGPRVPGAQYGSYQPSISSAVSQAQNPYVPAAPIMNAQQSYQPTAPMQTYSTSPYAPVQPTQVVVPPPPSVAQQTMVPPPPPKREAGGWNDAPALDRRTPVSHAPPKAAPIMSPFPNLAPSAPVPGSPMHAPSQGFPPPPPRPSSRGHMQPLQGPPPAAGRHRIPSDSQQIPPTAAFAPPQGRAYSPLQQSQPPSGQAASPLPRGPPQFAVPGRIVSPSQSQGPLRQMMPPPSNGQAPGHPPSRGPGAPPMSAPGVSNPYMRQTPPPGWTSAGGQGAGIGPQGQPGAVASQPTQPQQPPPIGPYAPPTSSAAAAPARAPPPGYGVHVQQATPRAPPAAATVPSPAAAGIIPLAGVARQTPAKQEPAKPAYPPGDRSHIPAQSRGSYEILSRALEHMKQTTPPQQKRLVDDTERRLNSLFDTLNCETISEGVVKGLGTLTNAMTVRDRETAMELHKELLEEGSRTDDIGLWMFAIKQLILRL